MFVLEAVTDRDVHDAVVAVAEIVDDDTVVGIHVGDLRVSTVTTTAAWCTTLLCSTFSRSASGIGSLACGEADSGAGGPVHGWVHGADVFDEVAQQPVGLCALGGDQGTAASPGGEQGEHDQGEGEGEPAAVDDFGQVRGEEREIDDEECGGAGHHEPPRGVPERAGDDEEQDGVDGQGSGDGDAVGGGECGRRIRSR